MSCFLLVKMSEVSCGDLLLHVCLSASDLNRTCEEEDLKELSLHIPSWDKLASFLNLSEAEVQDIKADGSENRVKVLHTLLRWKRKHAFKATFRFLVDMFLKLGDAEMAERVCKQAKIRSKSASYMYEFIIKCLSVEFQTHQAELEKSGRVWYHRHYISRWKAGVVKNTPVQLHLN